MEGSKVFLPTIAILSLGLVFTFTALFFILQILFFPLELIARVTWSGVTYFLNIPHKYS